MEKKNSGKKLEEFLAGKGFYIVLVLCAAVIGVSVWSLASGGTKEAQGDLDSTLSQSGVISGDYEDTEATAPVINTQTTAEPETPPKTAQTGTFKEDDVWDTAGKTYAKPIDGRADRAYSMDKLQYDQTMSDWRTHDGVDILADKGAAVKAAHAGTVLSAGKDDLYGVTVVIDQGGGMKATYSNLTDKPTVKAGDEVSAGDVIGYVGDTALCETAQKPHLHYSMSLNGDSVDPGKYLPA